MIDYKAAPDLLNERVILVTGAGSGIGAAAAKAFAQHGATVVLLGKTISKLEKIYDDIIAQGNPEPAIYPLNLMGANNKDYEELALTIQEQLGDLHGILHNAAYVGDTTPIKHYDIELWQRVLHINLTAPFMLTQACLDLLIKAHNPRIIFTTHQVDTAFWGAYGVAKAGMERLMQILADELESTRPIGVNTVIPGEVRSPIMAKLFPGKNINQLDPIEKIIPVYLYLMGKDSQGINGQTINACDSSLG